MCTHAVPCSLIAEQKRRGNCEVPLAAIVTDFDVHSYWAHPNVDLYLVANAQSRKTLEARGVPGHKIQICGIPIRPDFEKKISQKTARKKLGLDPSKPVVLVMGGSRGMGGIENAVKALLEVKQVQILASVGLNEDAMEHLKVHKKSGRVHVYGFTENISLMMDAADLLVSKPGGISSSEALAKGLPMILINPIPGQEERNARYLLGHACAVMAKNSEELVDKVENFLENPQSIGKISQKMLKISMPHAARDAAREVLGILKRQKQRLYASQSAD